MLVASPEINQHLRIMIQRSGNVVTSLLPARDPHTKPANSGYFAAACGADQNHGAFGRSGEA